MIAALFPLMIGLMASVIGFENFFTLFHKVLFVGDSNWLFDPLKDPVIWILQKSFLALFPFLYDRLRNHLVELSSFSKMAATKDIVTTKS